MAFCGYLKQSTAVDILLGPFIDDTDGKTAETGLTLDVEVSKNGQALANKNDATAPTHDAAGTVDGYYNCELDATDTGTLGILSVVAHAAGHLPVHQTYQVVIAHWFDTMCSTDYLQVDVIQVEGADATDTIRDSIVDDATRIDASSVNAVEGKLDTVDGIVDNILLDTDDIGVAGAGLTAVVWNSDWDAEVQSEVADALDAAVPGSPMAAILADTGELQTNQAAWATATGFSTHSAADVWTAVTRVLTANTNLNDPTAATIADAVWDEVLTAATHNIATSAGRRLQELGAFSIVSGTAATGTARTITLDSDASTTANIYNENLIVIIGGTGAGQTRMILEYTAGRVATVDRDWHVTPAGDSEYQIVAFSGVLIATNGVAQAGAVGVESTLQQAQGLARRGL
jgi:hypothetical protein